MAPTPWDVRSPWLAAAGALAGVGLALLVFGLAQFEPRLVAGWNPWAVRLFLAPLLPAAGAFLACACTHPLPQGWPFVRGGAALGAYFGSTPLGIGGYDAVGRYWAHTSANEALIFVAGPAALAALLAFGVAHSEHRRALEEMADGRGARRRRLLGHVLLYHGLAAAFVAVAVPQATFLASRGAPFLLMALPVPLFLSGMGSLRLLRATVSPSPRQGWRNLKEGLAFHLVPLLLALQFGGSVLLYNVIPGRFTVKDPYYQTVVTDYTLAVTPVLAVGVVAMAFFLVFRHRSLRGGSGHGA